MFAATIPTESAEKRAEAGRWRGDDRVCVGLRLDAKALSGPLFEECVESGRTEVVVRLRWHVVAILGRR